MRVDILSKREFDGLMKSQNITDENVEKFDSVMFISIVDSDQFSKSREPYFKENHENVITLAFDDVEHDDLDREFPVKAFTKKQAKELFQFIKKNRELEQCIVHCLAGISRSGAVGTFVNGYCGGNWELFKRINPHISPNARVERMLNQEKYNDF